MDKASTATLAPATTPEGFEGELRSYQAEGLSWLRFLDTTGLGGCLALDMGLGKTPTILAHLVEDRTGHPALVIAPPAVVGNWASEATRFTPDLEVVVHHGASRADADRIASSVDGADVVITTYATAVRDIEALERIQWGRVVLDEAQAIKNPANDTAQQLRRLDAHSRLALTGTPIENGLGDLWAILDFTNPGLVGARPQFIASLSGTGDGTRAQGEGALRALNGILVFRRTKNEPSIAAELPDRIDELDHCSMTPEQIGLYQAVLDSLVTGAATESGAGRPQGPGAGRHHRPQADLQPPRRLPRTTRARSRADRASWPASRRSSSRSTTRVSAPSCSPTSPSGARSSPTTSPSGSTVASAATTGACPGGPATSWSPTSRPSRGRGRWCSP